VLAERSVVKVDARQRERKLEALAVDRDFRLRTMRPQPSPEVSAPAALGDAIAALAGG
jgi:hypothetical protein